MKTNKIKVNKSDKHRVYLSETAPCETPIIFSNSGFYRNFLQFEKMPEKLKNFVQKIVVDSTAKTPAIPYRYFIKRVNGKMRQLSLLHPKSQHGIADFLDKYGNLICYYTNRSRFSIRSPSKIATIFYSPNAYENRYQLRDARIELVEDEKVYMHVRSFFAYKEFDRLYKFFESEKFLKLERSYPILARADIANCFDNIYTHTIEWAIKDVQISKRKTGKRLGFGPEFDTLMQNMNYGETNGICIGPEVSRIFAEIILQSVDNHLHDALLQQNLRFRVDYECFRYIDDYFVFARSEDIAEKAIHALSVVLKKYKLALNDSKSETIRRPFWTKKQEVVFIAKRATLDFYACILKYLKSSSESAQEHDLYQTTKMMMSRYLQEIRSLCSKYPDGYESIGSLCIGMLAKRLLRTVSRLMASGDTMRPEVLKTQEAILCLLEVMSFLYSVAPCFESSLNISKCITRAKSVFSEGLGVQSLDLRDRFIGVVRSLLEDVASDIDGVYMNVNPIPEYNIALSCVDALVRYNAIDVSSFIGPYVGRIDYFRVVVFLFIYCRIGSCQQLIDLLIAKLIEYFNNGHPDLMSSHDFHMAMDVLSCPRIPFKQRKTILRNVFSQAGMGNLVNEDCDLVLNYIADNPWFVNWNEIDFEQFILKRALTNSY